LTPVDRNIAEFRALIHLDVDCGQYLPLEGQLSHSVVVVRRRRSLIERSTMHLGVNGVVKMESGTTAAILVEFAASFVSTASKASLSKFLSHVFL
jgi:hypothetical protein